MNEKLWKIFDYFLGLPHRLGDSNLHFYRFLMKFVIGDEGGEWLKREKNTKIQEISCNSSQIKKSCIYRLYMLQNAKAFLFP
jgi:hypothetical protein